MRLIIQLQKAVKYHEKKASECSVNCPKLLRHHLDKIAQLKYEIGAKG